MFFPTLNFALFFIVVFSITWAFKESLNLRKYWLVLASYFFYGYWDWHFCFLLAASSLITFGAGLALESATFKDRRKTVVAVASGLMLVVLAYFKYYGFFVENFNDIMYSLGLERELPFLDIILPIGISFFTFQCISYVVDVYRGELKATRDVVDVLLYISFFPQLVAGPIVRAHHFMPQIQAKPNPNKILVGTGFALIALGLFKKVVIANYLATEMVDIVFMEPSVYGTLDLILAIYGYAIQIYCDFSAYSDIAIGIAALLGYHFPRNFNQPYRSESIQEFFRRWHISLSSWLRDYLYIPLGGSRNGKVKTYRNLFLTMLLGGVWHGAAWKFVIWGGLYGAALTGERLLGLGKGSQTLWRRALSIFLVFNFVCLTWIFFRSEDISQAFGYLRSFSNTDLPSQFLTPFILSLLAIGFAGQFMPEGMLERVGRKFVTLKAAVAVGVAIVLIDALGPEGVAPFIYFQF
ncbi:MAG: MBOAT family protein [Gallionellaceae bacterium]